MDRSFYDKQIDVDRKIYGLVAFGIICAISLVIFVNLAVNTAGGIRGFVAGEAYWAKAQKEAIIHLNNYIYTENEIHLKRFQSVLKINLGDRIAREELLKDNFDYQTAYDGFIDGLNHPEDIPMMISLFRRFSWYSQLQHTADIWEAGDLKIEELLEFANKVQNSIEIDTIDFDQKAIWLEQLTILDHELTALEMAFAQTMGSIAREINSIIKWIGIITGFTVLSLFTWLFYRYKKSTDELNASLQESEEKFKYVLRNSRDVLYRMNLNSREYEYVSPAIKDMLGYSSQEFMDKGIQFIMDNMHPEDRVRMEKIVQKYESSNEKNFLPVVEFRLKDSSGDYIWVSNARTLVTNKEGEAEAIVGTVREITEMKEQAKALEKSLQEKELLLKEIHHRVKNNLSIISSLLELQKDVSPDEVIKILNASQSRIKSIAKVHEKLYQSTNLSDISIDTYIREITDELTKAYRSDKQKVDIKYDLEAHPISVNDAVPFGLILNELVNNAFKHAFNNTESGQIKLSLFEKGDNLVFEVANSGDLIDKNFNPDSNDSLGMVLIQTLLQKLNGSLETERDSMSRFRITFNLDQPSS